MRQPRDEVRQLFESGVDAVLSVTAHFEAADWDRSACGSWTARQTAAHLVGVVDWYHEWLDRAIRGELTRPFPAAEIDRRTARDVERLADLDGADAVQQFRSRAAAYLDRTTAHWDTAFAYPFGVFTTGLHCGVAATEWHLHAWDLATATQDVHTPADPRSLFIAAGSCVAAGKNGLGGTLLRQIVPLVARRRPWETLLEQSGR